MRPRTCFTVILFLLATLTPALATPANLVDSYGRTTLRALADGAIYPLQLPTGSTSQTLRTSGVIGAPLFGPYQSYPLASQASAVAIGDVTGDGRADVVATGASANVVAVFEQTPAGTLAPAVSYNASITYGGPFTGSVAIADVNGDGRGDVILASVNSVAVMLQQADGHLAPAIQFATIHSSFSNVFKLVTGDFNHDGRADVASIDWGTQSDDVDVFLQPSTGLLSTPVVYTAVHDGYDDMEAGDVNGDGWDDIVVMSGQSFGNTLAVLTQTAQGTFGPAAYYALVPFDLGRGVGVGDVNGDGRKDVVVSHGGNGLSAHLAVFLQASDGSLQTPSDLSSLDIPGPIAVADLDGDGRDDVVTLHDGWLAMGVYLQSASGALGNESLYSIPYASWYNAHGLAVGDLNGDSKPDVAIADPNVGVEVLLNVGEGPPPIVSMDLTPDVLKPGTPGRWVSAYLEPSRPFDASQIDVGSLRLNGIVPVDPEAPTAIGDQNANGVPDLMVKFNRLAVELTVSEGSAVPVTMTGRIAGQAFSSGDVIRVLRGVVTTPAPGSVLVPGSTISIAWNSPDGVTVATVEVVYSIDDGVSWTVEATGLPNTGSFDWIVPEVSSDRVRIAILAELVDAASESMTSALATSGMFTIASPTGVGEREGVAFGLYGPRPSPARGRLHVELRLPSDEPASLALFDLGGRKIAQRAVTGLGRHVVDLGGASLPAGVYLIRLSQGVRTTTRRAALIQ